MKSILSVLPRTAVAVLSLFLLPSTAPAANGNASLAVKFASDQSYGSLAINLIWTNAATKQGAGALGTTNWYNLALSTATNVSFGTYDLNGSTNGNLSFAQLIWLAGVGEVTCGYVKLAATCFTNNEVNLLDSAGQLPQNAQFALMVTNLDPVFATNGYSVYLYYMGGKAGAGDQSPYGHGGKYYITNFLGLTTGSAVAGSQVCSLFATTNYDGFGLLSYETNCPTNLLGTAMFVQGAPSTATSLGGGWEYWGANFIVFSNCPAGGAFIIYTSNNSYGGIAGMEIVANPPPTNPAVATTCSLGSSTNNAPYGTPVIFTSSVSPAPPDGENVDFLVGTNVFAVGTLRSGAASCTNGALAVGNNSITAAYAGDGAYAPGVSGVLTQTVTYNPNVGARMSIKFAADQDWGAGAIDNTYGAGVLNTTNWNNFYNPNGGGAYAGVAGVPFYTYHTAAGSGPAASGAMLVFNFANEAASIDDIETATYNNVSLVNTYVYVGNGRYLSVTNLDPVFTNSYDVYFYYNGNTPGFGGRNYIRYYAGQTTNSAVLGLQQWNMFSTAPVTNDNAFALTQDFTPANTGVAGEAPGVNFFVFTNLSGGAFDLLISNVNYGGVGALEIVAHPAVSNAPIATSCSLRSSTNNEPLGMPVVFTCTVSPAPPDGESVVFMAGGNIFASGSMISGVATCTNSALLGGTNALSAAYAGDGRYLPSASAVLTQSIPTTASLLYLSITNGGWPRTFIVYLPDALPASPCPLILMLHGAGGTGQGAMEDTTEYRFNQLADLNKFIVAYPDGISNRWHDCRGDAVNQPPTDDVAFLSALIDYIGTLHPVDSQRVYAAGHSNGAMMCLCLAMDLPGRLAAICVNSGSLAGASDCPSLAAPISLLYCFGTADPIVPFAGGYINDVAPRSGTVLPALDTVALWTNTFSLSPVPEATNTFPNLVTTDDSTVTEYDYHRAQNGTELVYLQVNGGGHGWPTPMQFTPDRIPSNGMRNQDIILCDLAWEFFSRHTLDGPPLQCSAAPSGNSLQLQWNWGLLQSSTNLMNWTDLTACNPASTAALGLMCQLYSSGGANLSATNLPWTNAAGFFRLKAP